MRKEKPFVFTGTQEIRNIIENYLKEIPVEKIVMENIRTINEEYLARNTYTWQKRSTEGRIMGSFIEKNMIEPLNKYSKYKFRQGQERKELDCVCDENPYLSTEIKTTTSKAGRPVGSKTNRGIPDDNNNKYKNEDYHFYIFIPYNFIDTDERIIIKPRHIYVGILKCTDWKPSKSKKTSSATIPAEIFHKQFIEIY